VRRALAVAALIALAACNKSPSQTLPTAPPGGALVAFRSHVVAVELAVDEAEWSHGLMDRKTLGANAGMLFLFPAPSGDPFYMYRTLVPLSVAFLKRTNGQTYRVEQVIEMVPCRSTDPHQCHLYQPGAKYDAALEVNRGWFVRNGVHVGSTGQVGQAPKK